MGSFEDKYGNMSLREAVEAHNKQAEDTRNESREKRDSDEERRRRLDAKLAQEMVRRQQEMAREVQSVMSEAAKREKKTSQDGGGISKGAVNVGNTYTSKRDSNPLESGFAKTIQNYGSKRESGSANSENNVADETAVLKKKNVMPQEDIQSTRVARFAEVGRWFQTICWLKIPIIGFIYMIKLALSRKTPTDKKNFILGYLMYKVLVWLLAVILVYCLYKVGLDFIDGMLQFVS